MCQFNLHIILSNVFEERQSSGAPQFYCVDRCGAGFNYFTSNGSYENQPVLLLIEHYFLLAVFMVAQAVATAAVAVALPEKTAVMASPKGPQ